MEKGEREGGGERGRVSESERQESERVRVRGRRAEMPDSRAGVASGPC